MLLFGAYIYFTGANFYGTTPEGGSWNGGTINKFDPAANKLTVLKSFESTASHPLKTNFLQASDGKLYAMTSEGGSSNKGVIFSFDPTSASYSILKNFDGTDGAKPNGSLIQARDGKLYGITSFGGINNRGVIFSFDPISFSYAKLNDFDYSNGAEPSGSLIQASDGKLYGMTPYGGSSGKGVIFSYDPSSSVYLKLKDFDGTDGEGPGGNLIQARNGKLYGITPGGGTGNKGVIFSFDAASAAYTKVKDFDNSKNGIYPTGSLIQASNGKLYGVTSAGGSSVFYGVIFSFDPFSSKYKKLVDLDLTNGGYPNGSLIQASNGKLYGMSGGGSSIDDVIFSFDLSSSIYTNQKLFNFANGNDPRGGFIQATDGKLYAMTSQGGGSDKGVIFSFDPASSAYAKLKDIASNKDGSNVTASLIQALDGKLYGMTRNGGSNGYGIIFSVDPSSFTFTKLKDFDGVHGGNPNGSLMQAKDGKLYGITGRGGITDRGFILGIDGGVIFSFDPSSSTYTQLYDFKYDTIRGYFPDGGGPRGSLMQSSNGKLYGMAHYGGSRLYGVIFSFDPASSTYTRLHDFCELHGSPTGSLIEADDGKLYGLAPGEATDEIAAAPNIFSFDPSSSAYKIVKNLQDDDGVPFGSLIRANDGKLYGLAYSDIFSYHPSSSIYTKLYAFKYDDSNDFPEGIAAYGNLLQASDGKLYGMTSAGGANNLGVIFSYDPSTSTYTKLKDYDGDNGASPGFGSAFIEVKESDTPPAVRLAAPPGNATYFSGETVYLKAVASDANGSVIKVEFYHDSALLYTATDTPYTFKWENVLKGKYALIAKATDNSGLVTISDTVHITVADNVPPTVSVINPANGQTFLKGATLHLQAAASDADGRIGSVEFYNGTTLLAAEYKAPYSFDWRIGRSGSYTITAKATDNRGAVTASPPINVSVIPNQPPTVSIITPSDKKILTAPATINLEASAWDPDGRIVQVSFYNGKTVLTSAEHKLPYTYQWQKVPAGIYTITAVAKDNWNTEATSVPVTITITPPAEPLPSNSPSFTGMKTGTDKELSVQVSPNPAHNILNIYAGGVQKYKRSTISIISSAGVIMKLLQTIDLNHPLTLDVSLLPPGMYTIKFVNANTVIYERFVKL